MRYVAVTFKDKSHAYYNMEGMRITRGFLKIEHSLYGNIALPLEKIKTIRVEFMEDKT